MVQPAARPRQREVSEHYVDVLQAGLMAQFLEWLRREPGLVLDGGAGFNHPGRFEELRFDPRLRERVVSLEMFDRADDYRFEGYAAGSTSPLSACLDAGWRTGISGVTDEHGPTGGTWRARIAPASGSRSTPGPA